MVPISNEVYDAHASSDDPSGRDDLVGRAGHGSTLRSPLPGLSPKVGGEWLHRHRLQLYIVGPMQDDGVGTLSDVLGQPILVASTSGTAGPRLPPPTPRLLGAVMIRRVRVEKSNDFRIGKAGPMTSGTAPALIVGVGEPTAEATVLERLTHWSQAMPKRLAFWMNLVERVSRYDSVEIKEPVIHAHTSTIPTYSER
jgi:hypothetical protein